MICKFYGAIDKSSQNLTENRFSGRGRERLIYGTIFVSRIFHNRYLDLKS